MLQWLLWQAFPVLLSLGEWCRTLLKISQQIGSGNGLVPLGTKPLPEPMLTMDVIVVLSLFSIWSTGCQNTERGCLYSVFKIRSETCRTKAQFFPNLYVVKKESLPDRPQFCWSGSTVWRLFWRLLYFDFVCWVIECALMEHFYYGQ